VTAADIQPGQTWASRYQTGATIRVTVIDGNRIGFTRPYDHGATNYLTCRKFLATYTRTEDTPR